MNIVIVGATSGIGRALFEGYVRRGNQVGIIGRRAHLLEELKALYPDVTYTAMADITKYEEVASAMDLLCREMGHIDVAIISSGTGELNPDLNFTVDRPTLEVNVMGWTFVLDWLFRLFESQHRGHLVAITSVGALRGEALAPAYSASKAYQVCYMEALCKKAFKSKYDIFVTDVRPGLVNTAMAKGEGLFWVMPVEKVAQQIISAIADRKSMVYVTKRWRFVAMLLKSLPFSIYKRL